MKDFSKEMERVRDLADKQDKYKCWDCEKEMLNVVIPDDIKKKCPIDFKGYRLIICKDCAKSK